ncbi:MAG TPA: Ig-like domain-containing protein [Gemmatimonadaceae bacterium]
MQSHAYFRAVSRVLLLFLLVAGGLFCGGSTSGPSVTMVAAVTVSAPLKNIDVGHTAQLSAVAFDQTGAELVGVTFQWSSSDKTIATVSNTGVVTGVAAGSARITAVTGTVSGFADVTVGPMMTTQLTEKPIARG